jgi:hypothetical protein
LSGKELTLSTDATGHTVSGDQMGGVASNADFDRQSGEIAVILRAGADAGLYCGAAVKTFSDWNCEFVIGRKTERLLGGAGSGLAAGRSVHRILNAISPFISKDWDREYPFVQAWRYEAPEPDAEGARIRSDALFDGLGLPLPSAGRSTI